MRILEEFWYGNVLPIERKFKRQREYDKLLLLLTRNEENLLATLNENEKETFSKYQACQDELTQISECEFFSEGFRIGLRFAIEAYCDDDDVFQNSI